MMKRRFPFIVLSLFTIILFFIFGNVRGTATGPGQAGASDPARPSPVLRTKNVTAKPAPAPEIDQSAWQQIQSLLKEKAARTPAQRKIDSQLLYAIKMRRSESITKNVERLSGDVGVDAAGLVTVDITAIIDDQLLDRS